MNTHRSQGPLTHSRSSCDGSSLVTSSMSVLRCSPDQPVPTPLELTFGEGDTRKQADGILESQVL